MAEKGSRVGSRRMKGFESASGLLRHHIREAGESRGFAVAKVLTHWETIVGPDLAAMARPVKIGYAARGGFGATLVILTTGAHAPLVEMQKEQLRQRVNACYGYNAVSRIQITQTAAAGFAEARAGFAGVAQGRALPGPGPDTGLGTGPDAGPNLPATAERAAEVAEDVTDPDLRAALEALGRTILSRR